MVTLIKIRRELSQSGEEHIEF